MLKPMLETIWYIIMGQTIVCTKIIPNENLAIDNCVFLVRLQFYRELSVYIFQLFLTKYIDFVIVNEI